MKKAELIMAVCLLLIVLYGNAVALQNEPEGYGGIKWETDIKELPDMRLAPGYRKDEKVYSKKGDILQIGKGEAKTEVEAIHYAFHNNKFYMVIIPYKTRSNFEKLKVAMEEQYGNGNKPTPRFEHYFWEGDKVYMGLSYSTASDEGKIIYYYKPLYKQKIKDEKQQQKMKQKERMRD